MNKESGNNEKPEDDDACFLFHIERHLFSRYKGRKYPVDWQYQYFAIPGKGLTGLLVKNQCS